MKLIGRAGVVAAAIAVSVLGFESYWTASAQECSADEGRSYSPSVSVHPNERDLLFSECGKLVGDERACVVLTYNLQTKKLGRYDLPNEYNYQNPSFSVSGNWIVAERRPKTQGDLNEAQWQAMNRQTEIVMFRTDGAQFTVLPLTPGFKMLPVMSPDEKFVAFQRGLVKPLASPRQKIRDKDVWEVSLTDGKERLFAAEYKFYQMGEMQYLNADTLLVNADYPYAIAHSAPAEAASVLPAYEKLHRRSEIYLLRRAEPSPVSPLQTGFTSARRASIDRAGNLYFQGFGQQEVLHRMSPAGELAHRTLTVDQVNQIVSIKAMPLGRTLAAVLACGSIWSSIRKIALFDFESTAFTSLTIPPLQSSYQIAVPLER
jgi:hypothetical protein